MVRNVGKTIKIKKTIVTEETVLKEKIVLINIVPEQKNISVTVDSFNESNELIQEKNINISNENYDFLFSANEIFDEGKQEGSYREQDLWKVMDSLETR